MMEAWQIEAVAGTEETLLRLGRAVGLDRVRLAKDLHTQEVEAAFEEDRRTMERSRANFLTLIVSAEGKSEAKSEVFTSGPFEEMIDRFRPGLAKRAPTDILEYLEKHRDLTPGCRWGPASRSEEHTSELQSR